MTECTQTSFVFAPHCSRQVVARFDGGQITSDAGSLLLRTLEQRTGILRQFSACFRDYRNPERIEHSVGELVRQRVYGLALGYEDLNDHDQLRQDPLLALLAGKADLEGQQRRRPQDRGKAGAGKSTLNRLELTPADATPRTRYKKIVLDTAAVDRLLVELYLQAQPKQPRRIVLDLDATDERGVSTDLVRAYLNGIGRTRLLTAVEEVVLAKRIEAGLYAEERLADDAGADLGLRADLATIAAEGRAAKDRLLEALRDLGVRHLDYILLTHVHLDHSGAIGDIARAFPDTPIVCHPKAAEHLIDPQRLWEGTLKTLGDVAQSYGPVTPVPCTRVLTADRLDVPEILPVATPGHAPHHTSYLIGSGNRQLIVLGDVSNIPALFVKNPGWHAAFDSDGALAETNRRKIFDRVIADKATVTGYHFGMPGAGTIAKDGKGYAFVPVKA